MIGDPDNQPEPAEQEAPLGLSRTSIPSCHDTAGEASRSGDGQKLDDPQVSESVVNRTQPRRENEIAGSIYGPGSHNPQLPVTTLTDNATSNRGVSPPRGWVATVPTLLEVPLTESERIPSSTFFTHDINGNESMVKPSTSVSSPVIQSDVAPSYVTGGADFSRQSSQSSEWEWITRSSRSHVSGTSSVQFVTSDQPPDGEQRRVPRAPVLVSSPSRDSGLHGSLSEVTSAKPPVAAPTLESARSGSAKTMVTIHSASHSAVTQWRCNRSDGDGPPAVIPLPSAAGPYVMSDSQGATPPLPPQDIIATWERAIAVSLAAGSSPPIETLPGQARSTPLAAHAATLPQASGSLSRIMCRGMDAVQIQDRAHPTTKGTSSLSSARSTGSDNDRERDEEKGREVFEEETWALKEKHSRSVKKVCLFLTVVGVVLGAAIGGSVIAARGAAPSDGDVPAGYSACSEPSASLSLMMRDFGSDKNGTVGGRQDWYPSENRGSSFGDFVAVSEDGSFLAITERLSNGTWAIHLQPSSIDSDRTPSVVLSQVRVSSLVLNRNGTAMAVGLATGGAEVYGQDQLCKSQWNQLGGSIWPDHHSPSGTSSFTTTVSLSGDGHVIAMGLVTSSDAALYQVLRFQDGTWKRMGPAIEYGDENGSISHASAKVSLASTCSVKAGRPCGLATSRMFTYEAHSFGMISVRSLSADETSWNAVGQTIPFALVEASLSLSADGKTLAVSDAGATTLYGSQHNATSRDEWSFLGQNSRLPQAPSISLAGSGRRLALAVNQSVLVFESSPRSIVRNESIDDLTWKTIREIAVPEAAADSLCRVGLDYNGSRLIVGKPVYSGSGRVMVLTL